MLEETGLDYEIVPVDTLKGEQHNPAFVSIAPNAKVPVIEDGESIVFDSNAILLHLAGETAQFAPASGPARAEVLSWLVFGATGLSPFSCQAMHFRHMAPEEIPYAKNRYLKEVVRHYAVMDDRLSKSEWLGGDQYSIADIAAWGWLNMSPYMFGEARFSMDVIQSLTLWSSHPKAELGHAGHVKATNDSSQKTGLFGEGVGLYCIVRSGHDDMNALGFPFSAMGFDLFKILTADAAMRPPNHENGAPARRPRCDLVAIRQGQFDIRERCAWH